MRLLLVEDDDNVADALSRILRHSGFHVVRAGNGVEAMAAFAPDQVDAVLLDLGLPDMDGLELCRWFRSRSDLPLLIVTARGDLESRLRGLDLGADDYLTKPYDARELMARLRAVVRRQQAGAAFPRTGNPAVIEVSIGPLTINRARYRASVDGRDVALTRREFELLELLARAPGVVFTREQILRELWGTAWPTAGRSLEVHVASLRSKLGARGLVETVRGVGYRVTGG
ncbi:MAG: transcriptional regulator [Pseudonocardiales bacterium]|nr:transcriptional regulator [Jatrophihabitantaceae bacterium]MCW2604053.1 transcriptional regulator [Pseudonocardiales bacterium]